MARVKVLGSEAFGVIRSQGGALLMGLVPLYEGTETQLSPFHHARTQLKVGSLQPRRGLSSEPYQAGTMISDFQPAKP